MWTDFLTLVDVAGSLPWNHCAKIAVWIAEGQAGLTVPRVNAQLCATEIAFMLAGRLADCLCASRYGRLAASAKRAPTPTKDAFFTQSIGNIRLCMSLPVLAQLPTV